MKDATEVKNELTVYHAGGYGYSSRENGRSTCSIDCPFCKSTVICYVWSLAGGGKKCPGCYAILHTTTATKRYNAKKTCSKSCGPSDFYPGGKCDRAGCYEYDQSKFVVVPHGTRISVKNIKPG